MSAPNVFERRTDRGHQHVEAFCLMQYACRKCRHAEIIWNSRDGVTPFGTACPSCGDSTLQHVNFWMDRYAPDHKPHKGQRVWVSMTLERARAFARARVLSYKKPGEETEIVIDAVANDLYRDGHGPDLRIEGYTETNAQPSSTEKP